jgi:hypothetical protein
METTTIAIISLFICLSLFCFSNKGAPAKDYIPFVGLLPRNDFGAGSDLALVLLELQLMLLD